MPPTFSPHQSKLDATLVLSGLDTNVVSSPAMVRALVEPFGHVAELSHPYSGLQPGSNGEAIVVYCCSSSASLARLALHGLEVGRSRVQASVASRGSEGNGHARDVGAGENATFNAYGPDNSQELRLGNASLRPADADPSYELSRQTDSDQVYTGTTQRGAPLFHYEPAVQSGGDQNDLWRQNYRSATLERDVQDAVVCERVSKHVAVKPP